MSLIALTIANLFFAALATVVAFTGPTHPPDRPLWYLNARGISAAFFLFLSLAFGISAEMQQRQERRADKDQIDRLEYTLLSLSHDLKESQTTNKKQLKTIEELQIQENDLTERLKDIVAEPLISIEVIRREIGDGLFLQNTGRQRDIPDQAISVNEFFIVSISATAVNARYEMPVFRYGEFAVTSDNLTVKRDNTLGHLYGIWRRSKIKSLGRVEDQVRKSLEARWSEDFEIQQFLNVSLQVCAELNISDQDGGSHTDFFVVNLASSFNPAPSLKRNREDFNKCAALAKDLASSRPILDFGNARGRNLVEGLVDFLRDYMVTRKQVIELGLPYVRLAQPQDE